MLNRLNGWKRVGIVLSCLWLAFVLLIGVESFARIQAGGVGEFVSTVQGRDAICTKPVSGSGTDGATFTFEEALGCAPGALIEATPDTRHFRLGYFALALFAPVLLAWALAYIAVAVVRWVATGFYDRST